MTLHFTIKKNYDSQNHEHFHYFGCHMIVISSTTSNQT